MKYSLRSLMTFAQNMGSDWTLVPFALVFVGIPLAGAVVIAGVIFGVKWLRTLHPSFVASLTNPKLTPRELLVMTVTVAIALGWLVDHWRQASDIRYLMKWNREVMFDNDRLQELLKLQAPGPNLPKD